ncbi:MAG: hypothetical protein HKN78_05520 [Sphingomonadaceae bacterium]|nr:hypothetical protein [Sphingomonadaceae bacterium]
MTILGAVTGSLALAGCGISSGGSDETVSQGPDGEEITISRDRDNSVTYSNEDGETVVTTDTGGDTAVAGLPAYPGAQGNGGMNINATGDNGGSGQITNFRTTDAPDDVIAFYRRALERRGYDVRATMQTGQHQAISAEGSDESGMHITATEIPGQGTSVTIIAGHGG